MDASEYKAANKRMEELLALLSDKGKLRKRDHLELDRISDAIASYEEDHYPFQPETLIEMIELRMFQRKLKQKDLARLLGTTPSRISEIMNGKRDLTMDLARELYKKLNVDPKLILSE